VLLLFHTTSFQRLGLLILQLDLIHSSLLTLHLILSISLIRHIIGSSLPLFYLNESYECFRIQNQHDYWKIVIWSKSRFFSEARCVYPAQVIFNHSYHIKSFFGILKCEELLFKRWKPVWSVGVNDGGGFFKSRSETTRQILPNRSGWLDPPCRATSDPSLPESSRELSFSIFLPLSLSLPFFLFKFYPFFLFPFRFRLFFPIYFHLNGLEDSVNSGCLKFTSIKGLSVLKRPNLDDVIVARAQK